MDKDVNGFLEDILSSIAIIENHVTTINSLAEYEINFLVSDAVERRLAIIGEALAKAKKLDADLEGIPSKKNNSVKAYYCS